MGMVSESYAVGICPDIDIDPFVIDSHLHILMGRHIPDEGPSESYVAFLEVTTFDQEYPHHVVDIGAVEESVSAPERVDISYEKIKKSDVGLNSVPAIFSVQYLICFSETRPLAGWFFEIIDRYLHFVRKYVGYPGFEKEIEGHNSLNYLIVLITYRCIFEYNTILIHNSIYINSVSIRSPENQLLNVFYDCYP